MPLSNTVKTIQGIMRQDTGVDGDAQRIGQLGWMLFLKISSDFELETELEDANYRSPIPKDLRWDVWANENTAGKNALTGEALIDFVNNQLFPRLKGIDLSSLTGQSRERGKLLISVFDDTYNFMKNGTLLRKVINKINQDIDYNSVETRNLFGEIYEQILKDLQSAGNAGEYYTPRAVTQFAIEMVNPRLGEIVLDPACGTGGFLTAAFEFMKKQVKNSSELNSLKNSIKGVEKKPLPHVLCATNMMIHGIEVPSNIIDGNTLAKPLREYGKNDQVDVIITNPPFGGIEEDGIENNFPAEFRTKETADLFLVLVMELLKDGGRAAIVLPDGTLFGEGVKTKIKKKMLEDCNLHTIIRLPKTVFAPYTDIATNILFLTKGEPTKDIWYFEHKLPEGVKSYNKTKQMKLVEFDIEKEWWSNRQESEQSWKISISDIVKNNYNLDIKNPNVAVMKHDDPDLLLREYQDGLKRIQDLQNEMKNYLSSNLEANRESTNWTTKPLKEVCEYIQRGKSPKYATSGSCKVVSQKCVRWTGFDSVPARYIDDNSLSKYSNERFLKDGDLLWNSTGTGTVGRTAIFQSDGSGKKYVADSHVTVLRTSKLDPEFLYYWSRSPDVQSIVLGSTTGSTNQQELNLGTLKELTISFPGLAEQKIKVERIKALFAICDQLESEAIKAAELAKRFARSVISILA